MGFRLAELFVEIGARTGGLNGALARVHQNLLGMGGFGLKLSGVLHQATMAWTSLGAVGPIALAGLAAGTAAVAIGLTHAAFSAAHLQEAVAKTEQAFGSSTPKILAMADELSRKFGAVRTEILDVAASFGLMLQGAGVGRDLSAGMSVALSKMAVDAASYFDVEMSEAIQRMQSGLSGEMEAVRRWGVNLSETNVLRKAQAMGYQAKDSQDLDQSTKTLIRFKLIMEGLAPAAGDAERSQYRLIGQWKLLQGQLTDLGINIGTLVVPVLTLGIGVLNLFVGALNRVFDVFFGVLKLIPEAIDGLFGTDLMGSKASAENRKAIDQRIDQANADMKRDEELAKKHEADQAAAKAKKKEEPKGWHGGLEEYAHRIQEGAWEKKKDKVQQDQLAEQKASGELLRQIRNLLAKGQPAVT